MRRGCSCPWRTARGYVYSPQPSAACWCGCIAATRLLLSSSPKMACLRQVCAHARWPALHWTTFFRLQTSDPRSAPVAPTAGEADKTAADPSLLCDKFRVSYFQQYISNATAAVREDGVRLEGYFAWSLCER